MTDDETDKAAEAYANSFYPRNNDPATYDFAYAGFIAGAAHERERQRQLVLAWLGGNRDQMLPRAVEQLQDILGVPKKPGAK